MDLSELGHRLDGKFKVSNDGCWIWTRSKQGFGYGKVKHKGKFYGAHRISFASHNGPIPDGMFVCHRCDNPACINPKHLFLGTHADNMADCARKGRAPGLRNAAEGNGQSLLSREDAVAILKSKDFQRVLAKRYGVSRSTIAMLKAGRTWGSLHHG